MDIFSMISILNMVLKSYEIVYIFVTPSPPLTRRYLISETVDNSGLPLRVFLITLQNTSTPLRVEVFWCVIYNMFLNLNPISTIMFLKRILKTFKMCFGGFNMLYTWINKTFN